jgi:repressor LexA
MNEVKKVLGKKIRDAREERGITQKELGAVLNYSPMGISHFENGIRELKVSDIQKIADYFNKDISYFLQPNLTFFRASNVVGKARAEADKAMEDFDTFLKKNNP